MPMSETEKRDAIALVLECVKITGHNAIPAKGESISNVVFAVSVLAGYNPVELQNEVTAYVTVRAA
jgi:hypothetical protein